MEELENRRGAETPAETPRESNASAKPDAAVESVDAVQTALFEQETLEEGDVMVAEATQSSPADDPHERIKAVIEAAIYITEEPLTLEQIAAAIRQPIETVQEILAKLTAEYAAPSRGLTIRELAGGYKMSTKAEHHEDIRQFVRNLQPPFKLSLPALETLAVIAYKQPITGPEIMEIRGVQGAGVLKTLLDRRLIATAGRKNVVGKPMLYKTTKEFLVHFGLSSLAELPSLKEFEEWGRLAMNDGETPSEPVQNPGTTGFGDRAAVDAVLPPNLEEAIGEEAGEQAEKDDAGPVCEIAEFAAGEPVHEQGALEEEQAPQPAVKEEAAPERITPGEIKEDSGGKEEGAAREVSQTDG